MGPYGLRHLLPRGSCTSLMAKAKGSSGTKLFHIEAQYDLCGDKQNEFLIPPLSTLKKIYVVTWHRNHLQTWHNPILFSTPFMQVGTWVGGEPSEPPLCHG
jgi:hypothetical protein